MNIFKFSGEIFKFLENCPLNPIRKEKELPTAIMNMINQYNPIYSELTRIKNVKYIGGYSSFEGSPASKGNLQFDLWGIKPSERYDWNKLKILLKNMVLEILYVLHQCLPLVLVRFLEIMNVLNHLQAIFIHEGL